MRLEQIAQQICRLNGIDYHALSDSKKQIFLSQAYKARMVQTLNNKDGSSPASWSRRRGTGLAISHVLLRVVEED